MYKKVVKGGSLKIQEPVEREHGSVFWVAE
jgi:hypothetical protein